MLLTSLCMIWWQLRKEIDELRTLLKNQTAKQDKQAKRITSQVIHFNNKSSWPVYV